MKIVRLDHLRACLVRVRVKPIWRSLWRTRRTPLRALFASDTRKLKKLARKNGSREAVPRVKGADLPPPSPTLLLTKQALRNCFVIVRTLPKHYESG